MICPVCNGDSGHDKYMKYCPNCGARLETHIMSEEGNRYSNLFITDDNFDENMEKLADENDFSYTQFITFLEKLPDGFTRQDNKNGYEEWVSVKTYPNHVIDCVAPIIESVVAYEFANGFMLFGDRDSIYD